MKIRGLYFTIWIYHNAQRKCLSRITQNYHLCERTTLKQYTLLHLFPQAIPEKKFKKEKKKEEGINAPSWFMSTAV